MITTTGPASGFRDYYGNKAKEKRAMLSIIAQVYERYGFEYLETPVVERKKTLIGKGGGENEKLMYSVLSSSENNKDSAELGLRFDLTVPLARFAAEHGGQILQSIPFKRYAIGEVFRGERAQKGRYRSFTQCDADTIGLTTVLSEVEILHMILDVGKALQIPLMLRVNNRLLLDALSELINVTHEEKRTLIGIIDEVEKIGIEKVLEQLKAIFTDVQVELIVNYLHCKKSTNKDTLEALKHVLGESESGAKGVAHLEEINVYMNNQIVIDPYIARGLDYYTGIIFETIVSGKEEYGSVCSGGRYDNLIEALGGPDLPAVGTSFGIDRLYAVLEDLHKLPTVQSELYYVTVFDKTLAKDSFIIATKLRLEGKRVMMCLDTHKKLGKQFAQAEALNAKFTIVIGPEEKEKGIYKVKHMHNGKEYEVAIT